MYGVRWNVYGVMWNWTECRTECQHILLHLIRINKFNTLFINLIIFFSAPVGHLVTHWGTEFKVSKVTHLCVTNLCMFVFPFFSLKFLDSSLKFENPPFLVGLIYRWGKGPKLKKMMKIAKNAVQK